MIYTQWSQVPKNLKTISALRKLKLKPAQDQQPDAHKTGGYAPSSGYPLYDIAQAIPVRLCSPAQLAALEKARKNVGTFICNDCNIRYDMVNYHYSWACCYTCARDAEEVAWQDQRDEDIRHAQEWATKILSSETNAIILDTETTGLDHNAEIIQLAIIDSQANTLLDSYIKPSKIPNDYHEAQAIHGIAQEQFANAPTMQELWPQIKAILDQAARIIIYNAQFDLRMIAQSLFPYNITLAYEIPGLNDKTDCAMLEYAAYCGQWNSYHHSYTWQRLPNAGHTALQDCHATLQVIQKMRPTTDPPKSQ